MATKMKTGWYTTADMGAWERIQKAFANDWEQTKADMGVDGARDMDQDVDDTLKQAAGADDAFENHEQAFRFGYAAQQQFKATKWNDGLESQLRDEYVGDYDADRYFIRHAYHWRPER